VNKSFDFLTGAALTQLRQDGDLQIMFGIRGEHDLTERELPHLSGWRSSGPVRIGNGAWNQRQVDVYEPYKYMTKVERFGPAIKV
jgi:GH15 family glucan-1,4-alpha-glucosidase